MKEKGRIIIEKERLIKHMFLEKLLENCYIKPSSHNFFCTKCNCEVDIDWAKNEAYCMNDGSTCTNVKDRAIKEPITIIQNDKMWLLLGDAEYSEEENVR